MVRVCMGTRHPPRRRAGCQMVYDAPMTRRVALSLMVVVAGCASGGHKTELAAVPPPSGSGPLVTAGPRCAGVTCTCREIDDYGRPTGDSSRNEGDVAPGMKRFEFRT